MSRERVHARVDGTVQGVGFRPFVYRLADELALTGWVRNDQRGVELEVEGRVQDVETFLARLPAEAPPLARVGHVRAESRPLREEPSFLIAPSARAGEADALVVPDAATCPDCLSELLDPDNRRFRYPLINCTNCGPRFTIVCGVPYDRPLTTMADFQMCAACRAEYEDPSDRRFHAQPNACRVCGPQTLLIGTGGEVLGATDGGDWAFGANAAEARTGIADAVTDTADAVTGILDAVTDTADAMTGIADAVTGTADAVTGIADAVRAAASLLAQGSILAVKGLGGYHLAARADAEEAVALLRARKRREDRPFALMVADLDAARQLAFLDEREAALLVGSVRPIVLVTRKTDAPVAQAVAPRVSELGLMLPYTPLHHLLLADLGAMGVQTLVMTSGNLSDEPICYEDDEARARLAEVADAFLLHDRPIHIRTDDSVVRIARVGQGARPLLLRRSRGHVPGSLRLPVAARPPLLAVGAELKSTLFVVRGERAWVSHHIGDLGNWETLRSFREGIAHFQRLFAVAPEVLAHDLHPDYLSTGYAMDQEDVELLGVQHHHAHLAAVLAEHGECGPAVGAIYDGSGHGTDGSVWGGELLLGGLTGFERVGHLRPVRLPGGDRAVREPWRMACVWLAEATGDPCPAIPPILAGRVDPERWAAIARLAGGGVAAPITTSVGRLCDAVAALCGLRCEVTYEGQAAIELEAIADRAERGAYAIPCAKGELDPRPAILAVLADIRGGVSPATVSARFHHGLAVATACACAEATQAAGLSLLVLAGGVFQNRLLLERVAVEAQSAGLRVLVPERLPPNDGAISYGQAAIAAALWGA
jgi:hydrogenase maturation protein HypF